MTDLWGEQIRRAIKKSHWKNPCPLLSKDNPDYIRNRTELYNAVYPINKDLAQNIWWWCDGIYVGDNYFHILSMPLEECPKYLNSDDESVQVLIEWRLKHGQEEVMRNNHSKDTRPR
jgi:hypothetical protein